MALGETAGEARIAAEGEAAADAAADGLLTGGMPATGLETAAGGGADVAGAVVDVAGVLLEHPAAHTALNASTETRRVGIRMSYLQGD